MFQWIFIIYFYYLFARRLDVNYIVIKNRLYNNEIYSGYKYACPCGFKEFKVKKLAFVYINTFF